MVCCLNGDDVGEEVGPQQQAERAAGVGTLGPPGREGQHCKLLFGTQQHELWPEDHAEESRGSEAWRDPPATAP